MKILILSQYPWQKENSFGNTYSSIFGKVKDIDIAHIYMMEGQPDYEPNISRYWQIPESEVMKSALKFYKMTKGAGKELTPKTTSLPPPTSQISEGKKKNHNSIYNIILSFGKRHHWKIMFYARELGWKLGKVDRQGMLNFIQEYNPDLFFLPYIHIYYTNRLARYIKRHFDIPMILEMSMDHYTLNVISWNPLFWVDRFAKRAMIRKLVKESEMMYVISKKLKEECERDLHIPCKVLYKTPDETRSHQPYHPHEGSIKFLFTGNIYANRWKCLAMLAEELQRNKIGKLDIYTATPITNKMSQALNIDGVSELHEPVSQEKVIELQNAADVLIHTESFDKKNRLLVRCAISTKIMDYLSVGRCVLAIGPKEVSSFEYLEDNNLALIAGSRAELTQVISNITENRALISEYAKRSHEYVRTQLDPKEKRKDLHDTLQMVIDNYKKS